MGKAWLPTVGLLIAAATGATSLLGCDADCDDIACESQIEIIFDEDIRGFLSESADYDLKVAVGGLELSSRCPGGADISEAGIGVTCGFDGFSVNARSDMGFGDVEATAPEIALFFVVEYVNERVGSQIIMNLPVSSPQTVDPNACSPCTRRSAVADF